MKIRISILLLLCCTCIQFSAYADGYGGPLNNKQEEKTDDPKQNDCNGSGGKPVFLANGTEVYTQVDLEMKGLFPIRLVRKYSSRAIYDSPLGHGWAFMHNKRLFEYPDNSVVIRYGCGWQDRFVFTGGAYQTPKDGMEGMLVETNGSYVRTYRNNSKDFFDTEGRLIRHQSPEGHYHLYTYDATGLLPLTGTSVYSLSPGQPMVVARNYHLTRVEEYAADDVSTGNRVEFAYNTTTGRLNSATAYTTADTIGRVITYQHDLSDGVARGRLEKVTGLEGIESTYGYQGTTHFINSFQEGVNTTPYVNTLDTSTGRVSAQDYGNYRLSFSYPTTVFETVISKTNADDQGKALYNNIDTVYAFDNNGYVNKITDPFGNEKRIMRDGLNHLQREEFWTNTGTVASPSLVLSRAVDYIFDAENNKLEETVYTGNQWTRTRWTYDNGWVSSVQFDSNIQNSKTYRTDYTFYRDANNEPTNIYEIKRLKDDNSFQITTLSYDAKNRISTVQYPDGHIVRLDYENNNLKPTHIYQEVSGTESPYLNYRLDYDARHNLNTITDAKNQTTNLVYDNLDRLVQTTNPLSENTYYRYADNRLSEVEIGTTSTEGEGQVYKLLYTAKDEVREVQRKDESGVFQTLWTYTYDSAGNVLSATDASNRKWQYAFDFLDRLSTSTDPLGYQWQFQYDILGNRTSSIDPENQETQFQYDASNQLTLITELGAVPNLVTRLKYDALGNISQVIDPKNQATQYDFDRLSRLTKITKPLQQATQYFYDNRNRLDYLINERNQKIDYSYEAWGTLKQTRYFATPSSTTPVEQESYNYDFNGNISSITDDILSTVIYSTSYDALNRLETITNNLYSPYKRINYGHDRYGNVNQLTVSLSTNGTSWAQDFTNTYQYNKQDLLKLTTFSPTQNLLLDYYPTDEIKQISFANGTTTKYAYNNNGPLKWVDIAHGSQRREKIDYTYDKVLNVKELGNNSGVHHFAYDGINRLISASHPLASNLPAQESFGYDAAGNRENLLNSNDYDYDKNNQITKSPVISNYQFDNSGNLIQRGSNETFSYNIENQLTQYNNTTTGVVANYVYDPFGRRIKKEVTQNSVTTTTYYLWDNNGIIAEYGAAGLRIKRYSYAGGRYLPLHMEDTTGEYHVHGDHLDAPTILTNQAGDIVWRAEYEAYGNAIVDNDPDGDSQQVKFNLRRPGQWYDEESGLYYNYFRYYDPGTGRYITADPIGQLGGLNLYVYAYNSTLRYTDPLGLIPPELVPQLIIDNAQIAVKEVTNGAFSISETSTLTNMIIDTISLSPTADATLADALRFGSINPLANPIILTPAQFKSLEDIIKSLENDNLTKEQKELFGKAKNELKKAFKTGRCEIQK